MGEHASITAGLARVSSQHGQSCTQKFIRDDLLPDDLRRTPTINSFKRKLKT